VPPGTPTSVFEARNVGEVRFHEQFDQRGYAVAVAVGRFGASDQTAVFVTEEPDGLRHGLRRQTDPAENPSTARMPVRPPRSLHRAPFSTRFWADQCR
jgi:hypothetical protein